MVSVHNLFFSIFILVNVLIFVFVNYYIRNECECANDKVLGLIQPLDYISGFSVLCILMGIINLFAHLNKMFSSLPLIGTLFNFGISILCLLQAYMITLFLSRVNKQKCKEINKCQEFVVKYSSTFVSKLGLFIYLGAFIMSILLVWV